MDPVTSMSQDSGLPPDPIKKETEPLSVPEHVGKSSPLTEESYEISFIAREESVKLKSSCSWCSRLALPVTIPIYLMACLLKNAIKYPMFLLSANGKSIDLATRPFTYVIASMRGIGDSAGISSPQRRAEKRSDELVELMEKWENEKSSWVRGYLETRIALINAAIDRENARK